MRIVVTGAAGMLGSALVPALVDAGDPGAVQREVHAERPRAAADLEHAGARDRADAGEREVQEVHVLAVGIGRHVDADAQLVVAHRRERRAHALVIDGGFDALPLGEVVPVVHVAVGFAHARASHNRRSERQ